MAVRGATDDANKQTAFDYGDIPCPDCGVDKLRLVSDAKGQQTSYLCNANLTRKESPMRSMMRSVLMTTAFVAWLFPPAVAAYNYPFKTLPAFEISTIDGYQETYNADEPISITIGGKAQFDTNPETGFSMSASIYDVPRTKNIQNGKIIFDATKQAWVVTFIAPRDNTKNYEIEIHLSCGWDDRQCAQTYGVAAHIEKKLPLKIR